MISQKEDLISDLRDLWSDFKTADEDNTNQIKIFEEKLITLDQKIQEFPDFVDKTNEAFEKYTSLTNDDMGFLVLAITLQSARQVLLNIYKDRLDDKEAAQKTPGHLKEHSNRAGRRYYASIEEIITNPVPFDSIQKEDVVKRNLNPKLNGFNHRYKALGHDPYLGLIFGTANIMTSTVTVANGLLKVTSYHVHSGTNVTASGKSYKIDKLSAKANTSLIFQKIIERIQKDKKEGLKALATALFKECVHLRTDVRTSKSLPIPLLSAVSPNLTRVIGFLGVDYLTVKIVEKEYALSIVIDYIIKILYVFCYDESKDISEELYKVRCLKILKYSNEISTISSATQTWVKVACNDILSIKNFDFGGSINALYKSLTTANKIAEIQHEHLLSKEIDYFKTR